MRRLMLCRLVARFLGRPAPALPAPMSGSELLNKSDLVALVRINSVTCISVAKDERTGEELPSWSAKAELMEVIKGDEVKGDTVDISFHAIPTGLLGPGGLLLSGRDGVDASRRQRQPIHHHLVERPRHAWSGRRTTRCRPSPARPSKSPRAGR